MRRRILRKSEVLREGYVRGLRKAQKVINEMLLSETPIVDNDDFTASDDWSDIRRCAIEWFKTEEGREALLSAWVEVLTDYSTGREIAITKRSGNDSYEITVQVNKGSKECSVVTLQRTGRHISIRECDGKVLLSNRTSTFSSYDVEKQIRNYVIENYFNGNAEYAKKLGFSRGGIELRDIVQFQNLVGNKGIELPAFAANRVIRLIDYLWEQQGKESMWVHDVINDMV